MSDVIYLHPHDLAEMPPVTVKYFKTATKIKQTERTIKRWIDAVPPKIGIDKKTKRILFTEIFKYKKQA